MLSVKCIDVEHMKVIKLTDVNLNAKNPGSVSTS